MYKGLMLLLVFLFELAAIAALAWWGFALDATTWVRVVAGIGTPLITVVVWGLLLAPRARFTVPGWVVVALKTAVYAAAVVALFAVGHRVLAVAFAVVVAVVTGLVRVGHLDAGMREARKPS